jgi:hypothetical protein
MIDETTLIEQIEKALDATDNRKYRAANEVFRNVYKTIHENPFVLWNHPKVFLLGRAFMIMYHGDLFEKEEHNIELAHLSLFYLQRSEELYKTGIITNQDDYFQILRIQAVLLKTCEDCFVESVSTFYQPHTREVSADEKKGSLLLANRVMEYVLYSVLVEITDTFNGFKGDAFLDETCKNIEIYNPSISDKLLKEGTNVRKLLYTFCKAKIAKNDFSFM